MLIDLMLLFEHERALQKSLPACDVSEICPADEKDAIPKQEHRIFDVKMSGQERSEQAILLYYSLIL